VLGDGKQEEGAMSVCRSQSKASKKRKVLKQPKLDLEEEVSSEKLSKSVKKGSE
jgi:hypothetical protein